MGQSGFVLDLTTGRLLTPPFKHGGTLLTLDLSDGGRRLITAGLQGDVNIWNTSTGALLQRLTDLAPTIIPFACWSADGRFVVACGENRNARVWDATTGQPVTPRLAHEGRVFFAAITHKNRLLTLSTPNLLQAWDFTETRLAPDVIADFAKLMSSRRLRVRA
jgi:WD40 repeat protein